MEKTYIGIDIGKSGAIAVKRGDDIITYKMPMIKDQIDYAFLYDIVENQKDYNSGNMQNNPVVVFEKLGVIFGSSKATAFSMGHQLGAMEMMCISLGVPYIKIPAKEWQKEMFKGVDEITKVGKSSRDTKAMALVAIKRLLPSLQLTFGERASKPHDGLIDAVLMAEYANRKNL